MCCHCACFAPGRGGKLSTSADVLEQLASQHPLPGIILQHRKLAKLQDGFLKTLSSKVAELAQQQRMAEQGWWGHAAGAAGTAPAGPSALLATSSSGSSAGEDAGAGHIADAASGKREGLVRLRGSFLQTNTATGRLSMDDPPLQTIPRPVDFQLELPDSQQAAAAAAGGAEAAGGVLSPGSAVRLQQHQVNIRSAFVAPPGCVMLSADYAQIELRLVGAVGRLGTAWASNSVSSKGGVRAAADCNVAMPSNNLMCHDLQACIHKPLLFVPRAAAMHSHMSVCCVCACLQMAHLSGDPQMLVALAPHQQDPFVAMAAQWLKVNQAQVGWEDSQQAALLSAVLCWD